MNGRLEDVVKPYTYARLYQIQTLIELVRRVEEYGISGDFVECGVYRGGMAAVLAHLATVSSLDRKVWLFDSFEGLPEPTKEDSLSFGNQEARVWDFKTDVCVVEDVLRQVDADRSKVNIIKGWYKDTLPTVSISKIALLSMDSDWYESEKICINKFYDSLVPGGFIYFDDFYWWPGCRKAITEFFEDRGEHPTFNRIDQSSAWVQKEPE